MRNIISRIVLVVLLLPVLFLAGLYISEKLEHGEVRRALAGLSGVRVVALHGDYDVGISADLLIHGDEPLTIGAITDPDFLATDKWVYVEMLGLLAVWRVGCHEPMAGLPEHHRFSAIRGAEVQAGSFIGARIGVPIRSVAEAISRAPELLDVLGGLPACSSWSQKAVGTPVCQSSATLTAKSLYELRRYDACMS